MPNWNPLQVLVFAAILMLASVGLVIIVSDVFHLLDRKVRQGGVWDGLLAFLLIGGLIGGLVLIANFWKILNW